MLNINVFVDCDIPTGLPPPLLPSLIQKRNYLYKGQALMSNKHEINCYHALQMFILSFGVFILLRHCLLHLCTHHISYVTFNTNLN